MKVFLFENITFRTRLNNDEVVKRLEENIEQGKSVEFGLFSFLNKDKTTYYKGEVNKDKFDIKRINFNRVDLQPDIIGNIFKDLQGTLIKVKLTLSGKAFFLFIFGIIFSILAAKSSKSDISEYSSLFFILLFCFVMYIQILFSFIYESWKLKKTFQKIFDAEIIEE